MLTPLHETLVSMFRDKPSLVADVLTEALKIPIPDDAPARAAPGDLTDLAPTEYRADAVITFGDERDPDLAVVVEVQLRADPRKRRTWPAYVANLHARLGCPVKLLVICPRRTVATWCGQPIVVDETCMVVRPLVVGPQHVPLVTDPGTARQNPELVVLSALAHGGDPEHHALLTTFLAALRNVDREQAGLYIDVVLAVLPRAAREHLERLMSTTEHRYASEFARRYYDQGEARGKAEGKAEGEARAVLAFLAARGIEVPDDLRDRIATCTDLDQLDAWVRRAATAQTAADLLDD